MIIQASTFEFNGIEETKSFGTIENGTVEVTLGRETRRVRATRWTLNDGHVEYHAYDMIGRYQTSSKPWPASVTQKTTAEGKVWESAFFGRDDRSGRFNKLNCLFFAN